MYLLLQTLMRFIRIFGLAIVIGEPEVAALDKITVSCENISKTTVEVREERITGIPVVRRNIDMDSRQKNQAAFKRMKQELAKRYLPGWFVARSMTAKSLPTQLPSTT